jgi:hypothetical protein
MKIETFVLAPIYDSRTHQKFNEAVIITTETVASKILKKFPQAMVIPEWYAMKISHYFGHPSTQEQVNYLKRMFCNCHTVYGMLPGTEFLLDD